MEGGDLRALADTLAVGDQRLGEVVPALAAWRRRERDRSATGDWRYRIAWVPVPEPGPAALAGTWLVVVPAGPAGQPGPAGELARWCVQALAGGGAQLVIVQAGPGELDRGVLAAGSARRRPSAGLAG